MSFNKDRCIVKTKDGKSFFNARPHNNLYDMDVIDLSKLNVTCMLFAVKRILRYLKRTFSWDLHLKPASTPFSINAFNDAYWASDPNDKKPTSGAFVFFGPNLI